MNHKCMAVALALGIALALPAAAADIAVCEGCHGGHGEGNRSLAAPRLAGQDAAYLARQLASFKAGKRGYHADDQAGVRMRAAAAGLSDADMQALASQFSAMKLNPVAASTTVAGAGKDLYIATCSQCHGMHAQGYTQLQSPNLSILGDWYIAAQVDAYAKGWRGDAEGSDLPSLWMRSIATHIGSPKELAEVIHYIDGLRVAQ